MTATPDRRAGPRFEEEVNFEDQTIDPASLGGMRYVNGEFRAKDSQGVFPLRQAGSSLNIDASSLIIAGAGALKVIANSYNALELSQSKTAYGILSLFWERMPLAAVIITCRFILKASGTGTNIRLAVKTKARALGEDSSTGFDNTIFVAVPVNFTMIGEIFTGTLSIPAAIFSINDSVTMHIGRDGNNELGGGTQDNVNKPIQILAIKITVP